MSFCRKHMPKKDTDISLIDEDKVEFDTLYLANKRGLSAGWRGFAIEHELVDGDAVVFQQMSLTTFKVVFLMTLCCPLKNVDVKHHMTLWLHHCFYLSTRYFVRKDVLKNKNYSLLLQLLFSWFTFLIQCMVWSNLIEPLFFLHLVYLCGSGCFFFMRSLATTILIKSYYVVPKLIHFQPESTIFSIAICNLYMGDKPRVGMI